MIQPRFLPVLLCSCLLAVTFAEARPGLLQLPIGDPERRDRQVQLTLDGITDTSSGELITPAEMARRMADVELLFIGETHTRIDFHKVQLRTIKALHEAGREVMIGLEMFPHTEQTSLDHWIAGHYTEQGFVELAGWYRNWGYNWNYYRDIFLYAREHGIPMQALNTPREVVSAVRRKGLDGLSAEEASHFRHEMLPATEELRQMYLAFFAEDDALHVGEDALEGMLLAQMVWDATMGWNAAQALRDHGGDGAIMVVLIGAGHATYGLGSERQTAPYFDGQIASLIPVEITNRDGQPVEQVQASYANFIWGIPRPRDTLYPALEVSLMGPIGQRPTAIIQVTPGSVAERAGIRVGDVLLALDGVPVDSTPTLRYLESAYRWGDVITARLQRDGAEVDVVVPLRRR